MTDNIKAKGETIEWFDISDELLKGYQISKCGKVRNGKTGFIIKQHLNINGYWTVGIRGKIKRVHRLLAIQFIPNPENKPEVNHLNCIRTDYRLENLEWATPSENMRHRIKLNGTDGMAHGERNNKSKLTNEQVLEIRKLSKQGVGTMALSKKFNISKDMTRRIRTRKNWKHI